MGQKRKRNVVVASLREIHPHFNVIFTPYLWGSLKAYAMEADELRAAYSFAEPVWRQQDLERMLAEVEAPDVMAFSAYVWNHRNTLRLARAVKKKYPDCLIVFGGPQVPNGPSDYLLRHPWIDLCVHGEGERTFAQVLREALAESPDWSRIHGLSYLRDGEVVVNPPVERMQPEDYPAPYATAGFEPFMERVRREHPRCHVMAVLETNRGCPFGCTFCDWGMVTLSKIRVAPDEVVRAEMDSLARLGVDSVALADANFGILRRDVALLHHLADLKRRFGSPRSLLIAGMDKIHLDRIMEINRIVKENEFDTTGTSVNVSIQSMSQGTLDAIGRRNLPLERYRKQAELYTEAGYDMVIELILPLPGETLQSFKAGFFELASLEAVSRIRLYAALVLENAPMSQPAYREAWGIRTAQATFEGRLSPEALGTEIEYEERVIATSTMSEAEHADAKLFAAFLLAVELGRLLRPLRKYLARKTGLAGPEIYDRLIAWQLERDGVLAPTLRAAREAMTDHAWAVEGTYLSRVPTSSGLALPANKAIACEALWRADELAPDLEEFCAAQLPAEDPAEIREMVRFLRDTWIEPDFEPTGDSCAFEYRRDWVAFLDGEADGPEELPIQVEYALPEAWVERGYRAGDWQELALVAGMVNVHGYCHAPAARRVRGPVAFDAFGDESAGATMGGA